MVTITTAEAGRIPRTWVVALIGPRTDSATNALGAVQTPSLACERVLGAVSAPRATPDFGSEKWGVFYGVDFVTKTLCIKGGIDYGGPRWIFGGVPSGRVEYRKAVLPSKW